MQNLNFEVYALELQGGSKWEATPTFSSEVDNKCPKIYMLTPPPGDASILYVGQTGNTMTKRLNGGIGGAAKDKYKWANGKKRKYRLLIWCLPDHFLTGDRLSLEAVEAELTLAARLIVKRWPIYQTSINFPYIVSEIGHQNAPPLAIEMIKKYYEVMIATQHSPPTNLLEHEQDNIIKILSNHML